MAAAAAIAMTASACSSGPKFTSAWYLVADNPCGSRVTIFLVNKGTKPVVVDSVRLNTPAGQVLHASPEPLVVGQKWELHPAPHGRDTCKSFPTRPDVTIGERRCLPIRLFVSLPRKKGAPVRVDIKEFMPTAYSSDAFVACDDAGTAGSGAAEGGAAQG